MKWNVACCFRTALFLLLTSMSASSIANDSGIDAVKREFVGSWIVEVEGEARTRTLNVMSVKLIQDGAWVLDSTYGWTDGGQTPVSTRVTVKPGGYLLVLTTQANSVISAHYESPSNLRGLFTWSSGRARAVKLERLSTDEIAKRAELLASSRIRSTIKPPSADVPASCAAFLGGWTGHWPWYGQTWLWVVEVDATCAAKCTNRTTSVFPDSFQPCEIKDGVLARSKPEGMEYYEVRGDELWARYVPTIGNPNSAVFKRFHTLEK